jgi:hypothetical protein
MYRNFPKLHLVKKYRRVGVWHGAVGGIFDEAAVKYIIHLKNPRSALNVDRYWHSVSSEPRGKFQGAERGETHELPEANGATQEFYSLHKNLSYP